MKGIYTLVSDPTNVINVVGRLLERMSSSYTSGIMKTESLKKEQCVPNVGWCSIHLLLGSDMRTRCIITYVGMDVNHVGKNLLHLKRWIDTLGFIVI